MEFVALLRILWRRRVYVAAGLVLALAIAFAASRGQSTQLGIASTRVVIDTVDSQLVDAEPVGADTLAWRAALLGDLMGSDAGRPRIASAMGIPERDLAVVGPHLNEPPRNTPLARRASEAAAITTEPYVVAIQADDPLPIIDIDATAPSRRDAARLATAAKDAIREMAAAHPDTADLLAFVVDDAGAMKTKAITNGPRRGLAAALALLFLAVWCTGVIVVSHVAGRRPPGVARWPGVRFPA
jgi:hypothetical protein